jgi:hypothetical protein
LAIPAGCSAVLWTRKTAARLKEEAEINQVCIKNLKKKERGTI